MKVLSTKLEPFLILKVNPVPETFVTVKKSPDTAFCIVIPTEGKKAFAPPNEEVPTKNGVPNVTVFADVPDCCAAVDLMPTV